MPPEKGLKVDIAVLQNDVTEIKKDVKDLLMTVKEQNKRVDKAEVKIAENATAIRWIRIFFGLLFLGITIGGIIVKVR